MSKFSRAAYNVDQALRFTSANRTALALWGKSPDQVLGRALGEAFPEAVGSDAYNAHLVALSSLQPYVGRIRSPMLDRTIELEIFPAQEGLHVSFVLADGAAGGVERGGRGALATRR